MKNQSSTRVEESPQLAGGFFKSRALLPLFFFLLLAAMPLILTSFMGESTRAGVAPEITGIHEWFNSKSLRLSDLRGKVVLVDFWTYSCINCIRTLPYLIAWDERYREEGLVIIGVHTPEFSFEKAGESVQKAMTKFGIRYPVALDNDSKTWKAYANQYWPHKYLIDAEGNIRYEQIGEGGYPEMEKVIQELLEEIGRKPPDGMVRVVADDVQFQEIKTPEIYFGYKHGGGFLGNPRGLRLGPVDYLEPAALEENLFYLVGKWVIQTENIRYVGGGEGKLLLRYTSKAVNIVAGAPGRSVEVVLLLDGRPLTRSNAGRDIRFGPGGRSFAVIQEERLYSLVDDQSGYGLHTLTLLLGGVGVEAYTFTFG